MLTNDADSPRLRAIAASSVASTPVQNLKKRKKRTQRSTAQPIEKKYNQPRSKPKSVASFLAFPVRLPGCSHIRFTNQCHNRPKPHGRSVRTHNELLKESPVNHA